MALNAICTEWVRYHLTAIAKAVNELLIEKASELHRTNIQKLPA